MVVLVLGTVAYFPSLRNGFVYDDEYTIVKNSLIKSGQHLPQLLQRDYFALSAEQSYRPLVTLSYFLDYAFWVLDPFGYHLTNLLLHLATASVLFMLLTALIARGEPGREWRYVPLIACAIFAVHPINSEAVNCISFREDLLCGLLYIGALLVYVRGRWYGLSLVLFGFALLSKEMAVTLPAMVVAYDLLLGPPCHEGGRADCRKRLGRYGGYIVVLALYAVVAFGVLRGEGLQVGRAPGENLLSACFMKLWVVACDLGSFFIPARLSAEYVVFAPGRMRAAGLLIGFALLWAFLVRLLRFPGGRRTIGRSCGVSDQMPLSIEGGVSDQIPLSREGGVTEQIPSPLEGEGGGCSAIPIIDLVRRLIIFGCVWFFVTLLPVSGIYPIFNIRADRYMYLPSMGLCLVVLLVLSRLGGVRVGQRAYRLSVAAILFLVLLCFMGETRARTRVWGNELALWSDALAKAGEHPRAYVGRANALIDIGRYDDAISDCTKAIKLISSYPEAYYNRGLAYLKKGEQDPAIRDFSRTLELVPDHTDSLLNRGNAWTEKGEYDRAISDFNRALAIAPESVEAYNNRGAAYGDRGDYERALADFNCALRLNPRFAGAYYNRAMVYVDKEDYARALGNFMKARSLGYKVDPSRIEACRRKAAPAR